MGLGAAAEAEADFVDVEPELFDSATLPGAAVWVMAGDFRDAVAIREGVGCEAYGWGKAGSMLRRYGLEDRRLWAKPDLVVLPEILDEDAAAVALPLLLLLPLLVVVVVVALPLVERGCKALAPDIVVRADFFRDGRSKLVLIRLGRCGGEIEIWVNKRTWTA